MTYQRNGQMARGSDAATLVPGTEAPAMEAPKDNRIKVDGFGQVIDLLVSADAEFRESLLRRLTQQDPVMGANLRTALRKKLGL